MRVPSPIRRLLALLPGDPLGYRGDQGTWSLAGRLRARIFLLRRKFFTCRKEPVILYHGTTPEALPGILREGLRPKRKGRCSYLSPKPEAASCFGQGVLLQVDVPKRVPLSAFEDCEDWEVLCWGTVPPSRITVLEGAGA